HIGPGPMPASSTIFIPASGPIVLLSNASTLRRERPVLHGYTRHSRAATNRAPCLASTIAYAIRVPSSSSGRGTSKDSGGLRGNFLHQLAQRGQVALEPIHRRADQQGGRHLAVGVEDRCREPGRTRDRLADA